ncbi:MAG: hypothetical protein B7Z55_19975 [Planctomycetales bacterium 12-60-4]|nr:MAG: hypothetical protein B7Z55_19975 [Planctomycetales bacterium 12-60-4]
MLAKVEFCLTGDDEQRSKRYRSCSSPDANWSDKRKFYATAERESVARAERVDLVHGLGFRWQRIREGLARHLPSALDVVQVNGDLGIGSVPGSVCDLAGWFAGTVLALQTAAGSTCHFARAVSASKSGQFRIAVEYREEPVGRRALTIAEQLFAALGEGHQLNVPAEIAALRSLDQQIRLGPSTGSIVRAAVRRGIPFRRLNEHSLVQFGYGARQRKILAAETANAESGRSAGPARSRSRQCRRCLDSCC